MKNSNLRESFVRICLVVLGALIWLPCGEIVVRLAGSAPEVSSTHWSRYRFSPNPKIIYEPVPNFEWTPERKEGVSYHERSNSLGYRGPVYSEVPGKDVLRIAVIGDSISEGFAIENYSDIFPSVLEQALRSNAIQAEVMNFGVNGYQTIQEIETLKDKVLRYHPHIVVLQYCLNDTSGDDGQIANYLIRRKHISRSIESTWSLESMWVRRWALKSALYRFLAYKGLAEANRRMLEEYWASRENIGSHDTVGRDIGEFGELARQHGFLPYVVVFPRFDKGLDPYPYLEEHQRIRDIAVAAGAHVIDLLDSMRQCAVLNHGPVSRMHDAFHPNEAGHRCAGAAIASVISDPTRISVP